jgi:hypothetical protein
VSSGQQRAVASLDKAISEALRQSQLAYEFSPSSYTYGSLSACLVAENALGVIRAYLSENDLSGIQFSPTNSRRFATRAPTERRS